jgi:hypothetical protein
MKVVEKIILGLLLIIVKFNLCHLRDAKNLQIGDDCIIPNQDSARGICVARRDCVEYEELFNVTDLGVERLSYILRLDCGFDRESWKPLVCCPKEGHSYL